jgi:uncharacterized membrane protein
MQQFLSEFGPDMAALFGSGLLIAGYYLFLHINVRKDPTYTIHGVNELARTLWVAHMMRTAGENVIAVQTLRNFIMASILMASTASMLIIGTLTLPGHADTISHSWHILSLGSSYAAEIWIIKVMFLLINFIVAFFAFTMSLRLSNHVLFMLNVKEHDVNHNLAPASVARRLCRAGNLFAIGTRAFFFAIPLVFWLFGPVFLFAASIALVITLYHLDRSEADPGNEAAVVKL